jgi:hypothetical protein
MVARTASKQNKGLARRSVARAFKKGLGPLFAYDRPPTAQIGFPFANWTVLKTWQIGSISDSIGVCEQQDLTRSQLYRKSVTEYLKKHNVDIITGATSADPNSVFFQRWQEGANEGGM